ncbi:MAG: hypothetical protein KDB27_12315, partial [Planctomycetales bacterium]|nr:hypothetical protein [Planctomycetales bacterium]
MLARNTDGIPKSGFRVAAELADMPAAERKGKLSGVIKPASPTALLDVQLPRGIPRPQRLYLHVDGYPRAFIYDVSPIQRDGPVSETIDLMSVTVASPNTLLALNSQQKSVPVKVRVDSPLGAFSNSQDKLVVGLDVGQDRGLEGDPKVELRADRQVRATVNSLGPNGLFVVDTVVSDHEFELPIETATNCRADILCRLKVDNHVAHGTSAASVYLDSIAPRIISVDFPLANSVAQGVP